MATADIPPAARRSPRLLLVDDEPAFLRTTARLLERHGIGSLQAGSGEECLAVLKQAPVDVVVLDVRMPGIGGIEALRRIRRLHPETEVILLTGHVSARDGVEGIKSGAFDYLSKPIEFDHLLQKVDQAHDRILYREQQRRETEFRERMVRQMETAERLASLGTLATGVAHEINNPLAIINESAGWMTQLLDKAELADVPRRDDLKNALGKIASAVDRARRITHQLLGFVRKSDAPTAEVDLREILEESAALVRLESTSRQIRVEVGSVPDCRIWTDPHGLRQVLVNLLNNAIHASACNGSVRLDAACDGAEAVFTVRDDGYGIPKEIVNRIFDPFYTTRKDGKGTGLGLYVSRSIVEKLGGRIDVLSRVGHGSEFSVRLPRIRPES